MTPWDLDRQKTWNVEPARVQPGAGAPKGVLLEHGARSLLERETLAAEEVLELARSLKPAQASRKRDTALA